jgi:hypothetical protein
MTGLSTKLRVVSIAVLVGALGGTVSFWLFREDNARKFNRLKENALCVLDLPQGTSSATATFTTTQPIEMLHVGVKAKGSSEPLSILISGDTGVVGSVSIRNTALFGLGWDIRPGTYTVTLRQEIGGNGGSAVISGEQPVHITGWQIWSRTYLGLLVLSGTCVPLARMAGNAKMRALSFTAFHSLLLGLVLIFIYLLFHEGGHALAQITFGHFELARSDFWGIHGHPHSGGSIGPSLKSWQRTVISCAGPMLPALIGFALFLLWSLPVGRKFRNRRPMASLYFSAIVAMLVFSEAVCEPAYLLGFITAEGDLIGSVSNAGGPVWRVKGILWGTFLFSAFILWRVVPELQRAWKAQFLGSLAPHAN